MNINNSFCTPEQGRRLQELLPDIESFFVWKPDETLEFVSRQRFLSDYKPEQCSPALTLQELRDVASERHLCRKFRMMGADRIESWHEVSAIMTAPELAQWVIERLEGQS